MTDNVVPYGYVTRIDSPPDKVLKDAMGKLTGTIVMGWDKNDHLYVVSSVADGGDVLWLLEAAKHAMLRCWFDDE